MLKIAIHFHEKGYYKTNQTQPNSRRKIKMHGYQLDKLNYQVLKLVCGDKVEDIPRSRIVQYHYVTIAEDETCRIQNHYFLADVPEHQLPAIEALTKTDQRPRIYLWRDEQWWSFPQLETYRDGEMETYTITTTEYGSILDLGKTEPAKRTETRQIEKTKLRIRDSYEPAKGPGFALSTTTKTDDANPAGFPTRIEGNGMLLEWKRGYADKPPCWWLSDIKRVSKAKSQTYKHYATIKGTSGARWSRGFKAWYYPRGEHPPQSWLDLVDYSPTMPAELSQQIEDALAQDYDQPLELLPLKLIQANYGKHEWNFGNPDVWCKLINKSEKWILYIANASITERSVYGYQLNLGDEQLSGDWLTISIPDFDTTTTQRDPNFKRQSLASAIRVFATKRQDELPDEVLQQLNIPTDAECRRLRFQQKRRDIAAEQEAKRALAEQMQPYHAFHAALQLRQRFDEHLHHLSRIKALPAMATPPLDDPWN